MRVELQSVLVDLVSLALLGKHACRNVRGPHARSVEDDLGKLRQGWSALRNELAERLVALGGAPDVGCGAVARGAIGPFPPGPLRSDEVVHLIAERVAHVGSRTRGRIERVADDPASKDLLGRVVATLEDDLWALARSVALVHSATTSH